ncbi:MAG: hypothetical protein ACPGN3_12390 [Opitutales bacterium]
MTKRKKKAPVDVIRRGALKASFWENTGENGPFLKVSFAKTYRQGGVPKDAYSFDERDLLGLSHLAKNAFDRIAELKPKPVND